MPLPCSWTLVFGLGLLMIEAGFANRLGADENAEERIAPVERSRAVRLFDDVIFGERGAAAEKERRMAVFTQKIAIIDLICGLTAEQKQKLQLAGRGAVLRSLDQIESRRDELRLVADADAPAKHNEIVREAIGLRNSFYRSPFDDSSPFVKTVKVCLSADQRDQLDAYFTNEKRAAMELWRVGENDSFQIKEGRTGEIIEIRLTSMPITDDHIQRLLKMKCLQKLSLPSTQITNLSLRSLTELKNLESLDLANTGIDSSGIAHLTEIPSLRNLDLTGTLITDKGLQKITALTKLERLSLARTLISDRGLDYLKEFAKLSFLDMDGAQITDAGLRVIGKLKSLRSLRLGNPSLTDAGLSQLADLKNLQELSIGESQATEAGIAKLQKALPDLSRLGWIKAR